VIFTTLGHTEKTLDEMRNYGARILNERKGLIAAEVPLDQIEKIANDIEEIQYIRTPFKFYPQIGYLHSAMG